MFKKNKKILFLILFFQFFLNINLYAKIDIKVKVNNEIITNIDIENEKKYLIFLNPKLKQLENKIINKIAKDSLIKEIIKKKELNKFFDLSKTNEYSEKVAKNFYKRLNFKNEKEFESYLKNFNIKKNL